MDILNRYFAAEASEYLTELQALLRAPGAPNADRFFQLSRGVRGGAVLARAEPIAQKAERLESFAAALRDGRVVWREELRPRLARAVDELRELVDGDEETEVIPIERLFHDDGGPHVLSAPVGSTGRSAAPDEAVVPIETLLLRGERALDEALAARPAIERMLATQAPGDSALRDALTDLFELIELGRADSVRS